MFRKIIILLISIIVWSGIAFAGTLVGLSCNKCGFKSSSLTEGCGFTGVWHTIVFCNSCKNFYSIPTKIVFTAEYKPDADIVEPIGKEEFLGEERLVYPCPECGSKAFAYTGPRCPICNRGVLKKEEIGLWD